MKKRLVVFSFSLFMSNFAMAVDKIAIVDMSSLFQEVALKTGISKKLESEFKIRENELQSIEGDLQSKIKRLQRDAPIMQSNERSQLEKDVMSQRQTFSQKAQAFEQDRQIRSNEERDKIFNRIQTIVKRVAIDENIDLVVDTNAIIFRSNDIKDITASVLKQVK